MIKILKINASALFFIAILTACDSSKPLTPLPEEAVILAFGDSLTYGTGAAKDESYPAILQKLLNKTVINAGVPGEISGEGRARLENLLEHTQPDLVILCHGGNDLLRKLSKIQLKKNLNNMIERINRQGIPVLLVAVPEPNIMLSAPELYSELAELHALNLEINVLPEIMRSRALKSDAIHPNAAGYRKFAHAISKQLVESGAVSAAH